MDRNGQHGRTWLYIARIDVNVCKYLEMAVNGCNWIEMDRMAVNGCEWLEWIEWLEMAGIGWTWLKLA